MMRHSEHGELKRIRFILGTYHIAYNGTLFNKDFSIISLETFNKETCLDIDDVRILMAITFQELNLPLIYWKKVKIENEEGNIYPENFVVSYNEPIESLEFPGYFIIPYYSNYVISKTGRVIKKSNGEEIFASRGVLGYYTYRLTDDFDRTQNFLRHRILGYAFLTIPVNYKELTINHLNGIKGDDKLDNLEWATHAENNRHAVDLGLRSTERKIEVYDRVKDKSYLFGTLGHAAKFFDTNPHLIGRRAVTNGLKVFEGYQYRYYDVKVVDWPNINEGKYEVIELDGSKRFCDSLEAARVLGVTRTSLMRLMREGRNTSNNGVIVNRYNQSPVAE